MSFSGKEYSSLDISMSKITGERVQDERRLSSGTSSLGKN